MWSMQRFETCSLISITSCSIVDPVVMDQSQQNYTGFCSVSGGYWPNVKLSFFQDREQVVSIVIYTSPKAVMVCIKLYAWHLSACLYSSDWVSDRSCKIVRDLADRVILNGYTPIQAYSRLKASFHRSASIPSHSACLHLFVHLDPHPYLDFACFQY